MIRENKNGFWIAFKVTVTLLTQLWQVEFQNVLFTHFLKQELFDKKWLSMQLKQEVLFLLTQVLQPLEHGWQTVAFVKISKFSL